MLFIKIKITKLQGHVEGVPLAFPFDILLIEIIISIIDAPSLLLKMTSHSLSLVGEYHNKSVYK